jgi:NAD(P)-dependent dehydrogenase (short-subunit alcohol dehydrogenase family)
VIIVDRDEGTGEAAAKELRRAAPPESVELVQADLSSMRNVRGLAESISDRWPSLDYLVLCAGVMRGRFSLTAEGIETTGRHRTVCDPHPAGTRIRRNIGNALPANQAI